MLVFAPPSRHAAIRERLRRLLHVPFKFSHSGSEIIFFSPEQDYTAAEADRLSHPILPFRELKSVNLERDVVKRRRQR
jgi:hypothetical protein